MEQADILQIVGAIAPVIEQAIAERSEQVYTTVEELRAEVAEAVQQIRDTAQVLHDNDVSIMAKVMEREGDEVAGFAARVEESWERFVRGECERMGLRVMVEKKAE